MIIGWCWSVISHWGHGRPVRCSTCAIYTEQSQYILTFKYLYVGNVLFCPERIFGDPCPFQPPFDSAFSLYINPKGGLWHSCVFRDRPVSLLNTHLEFLSKKNAKKHKQSCTLWAIIIWTADIYYIVSWILNSYVNEWVKCVIHRQ